MWIRFLSVLVFFGLYPAFAQADILLYPLRGTGLTFVLEGEVQANPGGSVSFRHPYGSLYFKLKDISFHEVPTTRAIANRKLQKAIQDEQIDVCLEAARWALHHALLPEFYKATSAAWKLDAKHPTVARLARMREKIAMPVPISAKQEEEIREFVPVRDGMSFARSKHFLLMHDTPPATGENAKKSRADERLELLESVYEAYLLKFSLEGFDLEVPKEHLKIVLFAHKDQYLEFGRMLGKPILSKAAGFYDRRKNIAVYFDQGTNEIYDELDGINTRLQQHKKRAIAERSHNAAEVRRFADTLQLLTAVAKKNADIEVVSHETTHLLAANTGLMPNNAPVSLWAAEGLATYFEAPKEAAWSGIGAVNKQRLEWYRDLSRDRVHSALEFTVSDRIFTHAASDGAMSAAYGQSRALTHFLMERHFDKLIEFYQITAEAPPESFFPEEVDLALGFFPGFEPPEDVDRGKDRLARFKRVFGDDTKALELEWKTYMRSLKTDIEKVLKEK